MQKILSLSLLVFTLLLAPKFSLAQAEGVIIDPVLVYFKGRLVDKLTGKPVPYANVVNLRTRGGTSTDINGNFSLEMLNVDTMMVSVLGYSKDILTIPLSYQANSVQEYRVEPIRFPIAQVDVMGKKRELDFGDLGTGKVDTLSPEYRAWTWTDKPKWWQAVLNPLKYAQYHGKGEKQRREMREALASEADWIRLTEYYNQAMVYELTGLKGAEADEFMMYFNKHNQLTGRATEYDVRKAITDLYGKYMKERHRADRQEINEE